jgi:hypothetical protein
MGAMDLNEIRTQLLAKALAQLAKALRDGLPAVAAGAPLWRYLVQFRPPKWVDDELAHEGSGWYVHRIEEANGPLNLDFYPVTVRTMPVIDGERVNAETLLEKIRRDLNLVVAQELCKFTPFDADQGTRYQSSSPVGSVVHIDMSTGVNVEDGSVVVGEAAEDHWIFSTVWVDGDFDHPVSGNRWFGFARGGDGSVTYFTCGADRPTGVSDNFLFQGAIFSGAHKTWLSLQNGIARLVNDNSGEAKIGVPHSERYDWDQMSKALR